MLSGGISLVCWVGGPTQSASSGQPPTQQTNFFPPTDKLCIHTKKLIVSGAEVNPHILTKLSKYFNPISMQRKVLVLGATGFIGGHVARSAIQAGWSVRGLRRNRQSTGHLGNQAIQWVHGDLRDYQSILKAMHNVDIVFHAAGYYPKGGDPHKVPAQIEYARDEINRVLHAVRQAGVARLVYTSSLTTIGQPPDEEERLADERDVYTPGSLPKSGYYESKIVMEQAVMESVEGGLDTITLNPCAVFGPGDVHLTLGRILIAVARGYAIAFPATINVVDVRDVATAHIKAAEIGRTGERYILGGHNLSVKNALTQAARVAGVTPPLFKIPIWAINGFVSLTDAVPLLSLPSNHLRAVRLWQGYNTSKAQRMLGLTPRPFSTTVREALEWLHKQGYFD